MNRTVLINADVITMDDRSGKANALAVQGDRIFRVGDRSEMPDLAESGWEVLDLAEAVVTPGFIDTHHHMMLTGLGATGVPLADVISLDQILARVSEAASRTCKGEWIRGGNLNELNIAEKRMPTAAELDRAAPGHPVYLLHATCHMCSFNTRALEIVKPPAGMPGVDLEGGRLTGVVRDPAILTHVHPAMGALTPEEDKVTALRTAADMALDQGVTTVHALDGGGLGPGDIKVIWRNRDHLPVRVVCYNQSMDIREVQELGLPRVGGCICADGAFEAHTAALFEPYEDEPDNYGALTYPQEVMDDFIISAHLAGLQYPFIASRNGPSNRCCPPWKRPCALFPGRTIGTGSSIWNCPRPYQIDRMARAGIMASMQPAFIPAFIGAQSMEIYEQLLGRTRLRWVHPYRTVLDHGIPICGGSDSPVTPYAPLVGVQAAVNHPNELERVTRMEALAMFTRTAAWSAFEEKDKGTIEPGKLADLVVLNGNPLTVPADRIADITVKMVFVGGQKARP